MKLNDWQSAKNGSRKVNLAQENEARRAGQNLPMIAQGARQNLANNLQNGQQGNFAKGNLVKPGAIRREMAGGDGPGVSRGNGVQNSAGTGARNLQNPAGRISRGAQQLQRQQPPRKLAGDPRGNPAPLSREVSRNGGGGISRRDSSAALQNDNVIISRKNETINEKSSAFEIEEKFVGMNFQAILTAEENANLTPAEIREKEKAAENADKNAKKARKRKRRIRATTISLILLVIGTGILAAFWWQTATMPMNVADKNSYRFEVEQGNSTEQIATALQKAKFIRSPLAFRIYAKFAGGKMLQAGTHMLSPSDNLSEIYEKLTRATTDEIDVLIPPGLSLAELKIQLKKYDFTDEEIDAAFRVDYVSPVFADRPEDLPVEARLEGYIYPETYRIYAKDGVSAIIEKSLQQLEKVAEEKDLRAKFANHNLSFYEGLTMASIVVREVKNANDQKTVAGVFFNRLHSGMPLGADPTFKYAFSRGLCSENSPNCDSEYNTRIFKGLPPGPIANANLSALLAVAEPTESNYYFFVAGDGEFEGKTFFAATQGEQDQNIAKYCTVSCR